MKFMLTNLFHGLSDMEFLMLVMLVFYEIKDAEIIPLHFEWKQKYVKWPKKKCIGWPKQSKK